MDIEIVVNGEARRVPEASGLLDLLRRAGRDPRTVAVEYNGDILPRERYGEVSFAPGDRVEVVHFVQGGSPPPGRPRGAQKGPAGVTVSPLPGHRRVSPRSPAEPASTDRGSPAPAQSPTR